jgi:hypothetical protein
MPTPPEPVEDAFYYPVVMTRAGTLPQTPASLRTQLINLVTYGTDAGGNQVMPPLPGYTATLPGSLIEDISSTDVGAVVLCDQARVELINSLTPYGANAFIMAQLGQLFGIPFGTTTNVSVQVIFSGTVGYLIQAGFLIGDGTNTYIVQDGGIIGQNGQSIPLTAVASTAGSFAVPAGTVTQILTSVPLTVGLAVQNPLQGSGGQTVETEQQYRLRVLQASVATCQGTPAFLKTQLEKIPGVSPQQTSVVAVPPNQWMVICGGSNPDPYAVAGAIYRSMPVPCVLTGSVLNLTAATQANPGRITTGLKHLYASGQVVTFSGVLGMVNLNTGSYTVTVVDPWNFTIGVNTTTWPAYTGGGVAAPNLRNNSVPVSDFPDTYFIPFVTPPVQQVSIVMKWEATVTVPSAQVLNQLAQTAIVTYVNEIPAGNPLNLLAAQEQAQDAMETLISLNQISGMSWIVTIDNLAVSPPAGLMTIMGDPNGYFQTAPAQVTVTQGP